MAAVPGGTGDDRIKGEQAALRRVATLVAGAAAPVDVFISVTEEARRLLGADYISMARYDPDGTRTVVAAWSSTGASFPVGDRARLGGRNVPTLVFQTGRAARIDDCASASGPLAEGSRAIGLRAAVGVPIRVEGGLWGVIIVGSRAEPLPADTEARLAGFTELAATAIANAQARTDLRKFAEEQAALRRVATLVARAAAPAEVFAAVTEEAGRLLGADYATMARYDADGTVSTGRRVEQHRRCLPRRHPGKSSAGGTWRRWCSRPAGRRGSTTTPAPRARLPRPPASSASARLSACPSASRGGCGASCSWHPAGSRCPPAPRRGWPGSPNWPRPRSPTPQARVELRGFAEEQAALRRVATLVAHAAPPARVLTAVTEEAGRLLHADYATMHRYGPDGTMNGGCHVEQHRRCLPRRHPGKARRAEPVTRWCSRRAGRRGSTTTFRRLGPGRRGRPRVWHRRGGRRAGQRRGSAVGRHGRGIPRGAAAGGHRGAAGRVHRTGRAPRSPTPKPRTALTASRARIVATADATRRRIERNLHDGAQQRLVSLALDLRAAEAAAPAGAPVN